MIMNGLNHNSLDKIKVLISLLGVGLLIRSRLASLISPFLGNPTQTQLHVIGLNLAAALEIPES